MDGEDVRGNRVRTSMQLDPDQIPWLRERAREQSISMSAVVRQALRAEMNREEAATRWRAS